MAVMVPIGGAPPDAALNFSGDETNELTVTADAYSEYIYVGEGRVFGVHLAVAGPVTGTNPTLDVSLQDSADGITVSNTAMASFSQRTADDVTAYGTVTEPQRLVLRTRTGFPYVRAYFNLGGTATPTFVGVSLIVDPILSAAP